MICVWKVCVAFGLRVTTPALIAYGTARSHGEACDKALKLACREQEADTSPFRDRKSIPHVVAAICFGPKDF